MIEFIQAAAGAAMAVDQMIKTSSKEYKEKEALRRAAMSIEERRYEDTCKFNKRLARF